MQDPTYGPIIQAVTSDPQLLQKITSNPGLISVLANEVGVLESMAPSPTFEGILADPPAVKKLVGAPE